MAAPTESDDPTRPPRQPPITRLNSPAQDPSLCIRLNPPPVDKEPVRDWLKLPYPYKIPFPFPSETGYALLSSAAGQINHIDSKWNSLQHHEFLETLRERGEEIHLEPVAVQTLSQFGHDLLRRKQKMAYYNSLPLKQQISSAEMMPNNMTVERYLAQLQQEERNGTLDEQLYRMMAGLPPLPPPDELPPQPSEEEQAQLLIEGAELLTEGLVCQETHYTASTLMQQKPDQYDVLPSPGHHGYPSHVHAEPYGGNFETADRQLSRTEHPLAMLTAPLQLSPTPAAQPPPTRTQSFNSVGEQAAGYVHQDQFDSSGSAMPQQTMRKGMGMGMAMGHDHQFESGMMVPHQMPMSSPSVTRLPGQIIAGSMLQEHDELRQKQRNEQALQLMSQIIASILKQQPSIEHFRMFLRQKNVPPHVRNMVWNHPAVAPWRKQKNTEYVAELQEKARSIHQLDCTFSAFLMLAQKDGRGSEWINDVTQCASELGWNARQKRAEMIRSIQQVAERMVSMNVSVIQFNQFVSQKNYPKQHIMELIQELGRRGWDYQQKKAELQMMTKSLSHVQQWQQQPTAMMQAMSPGMSPMQDTLPNQSQSLFLNQTMSPPQQIQSSFRSQTISPSQQMQQRQRSVTPAVMNGSSPYQQTASHTQYAQNILYQQQAQNMGFLPTPSPGASSGQAEAFQTQMHTASNQGQGVPMYPDQAGMQLADSPEMFLNSSSPYMSRTPGREPTASPRNSVRRETASTGKITPKGRGNRHSKEPEPWEKQSGVLHSSPSPFGNPETPVCSPAKPNTIRHHSGLTFEQQNRMEASMRKQQTESQAKAAEDAARKQGEGQHHADSGNELTQMFNARSAQGTSYKQAQANNKAPTAPMVAKRPAEDQAELEMPKSKRSTRGIREWGTG